MTRTVAHLEQTPTALPQMTSLIAGLVVRAVGIGLVCSGLIMTILALAR